MNIIYYVSMCLYISINECVKAYLLIFTEVQLNR